MLTTVLATISRHNLVPEGARVAVAVSGGCDSVCLVHALREIGAPLAGVAHIDHQLRGEESDLDHQFVAQLAGSLELPFFAAVRPVAGAPGNLEQAARRARREFFASLIQAGHATHVALGHTRDDQAETVLFRLLRGSGISGLAGILPITRDRIVRPLLDVTRAQILEFLGDRGIAWREDSSNRESRFARNRIRRDLLPQLTRDWNPRLAENLAHLADLAYEEERYWAAEVSRQLAVVVAGQELEGQEMDCGKLSALAPALARRVIRAALAKTKGDLRRIEFQHIERILDLARQPGGGGEVDLPGLTVTRSFDSIRLNTSPNQVVSRAVPVIVPGVYPAPSGNSLIHLEFDDDQTAAGSRATLNMELCWRKLPEQLELRGWRPGDHYRPAGQAREQKLKAMFQRAKVPSWERSGWPILSYRDRVLGDKILWAKQFGAAAEFAATSDSPQRVRIRESPARPGA